MIENNIDKSVYDKIVENFKKARSNLLLVVIITMVNVFLIIFRANISFLFSATFPALSVAIGDAIAEINGNMYYILGIVVAFLAIAIYFVCYLFSKKYQMWILVALIFFTLDTFVLLGLFIISLADDFNFFDLIFDIAFHAWILYYLIIGVKSWVELRKLPPVEEMEKFWEIEENSNVQQITATDDNADENIDETNEQE